MLFFLKANSQQQSTGTNTESLGLISSRRKSANSATSSSVSSNLSNIHNYYAMKASGSSTTPILKGTAPPPIDHSVISANKDKVYKWILEQSKKFRETYFPKASETSTTTYQEKKESKKTSHRRDSSQSTKASKIGNGLDVLDKLKQTVFDLDADASKSESNMRSLKRINTILHETDISSFEMIHSGLIEKLIQFLSVGDDDHRKYHSISNALFSTLKINASYLLDLNRVVSNEFKALKLKQFLNAFLNLPLMYYTEENSDKPKKNVSRAYFSLLAS